ncbi:CLK4-associating serine/arginine rich protein [Anopheles ziemanni]|uniref:CLK4-associating serine/arginine rich protein n=1 Tax=Anopheles ziemanni TaxID=345580 RepID=UPI00265DCF3E|nr:CLK4-associating serine/arginine rich protein [Anopheles ziemanni]
MWHEARKQEKKIRGMLVDYRKRAERRQDFYERIKADPTQFLQVHGRKCKVHLDASVATAAENPAIMMPWQGQKDNMIDRFDVRAHLDYIPPVPRTDPEAADQQEEDADERAMYYERYRVLAQNEFLGTVEEKFLHQLYLEEQFGVNAQVEAETKAAAAASKKKSSAGAAIGYTYEETETVSAGGSGLSGTGSGSAPIVPFVQSITAIEKSSDASSSTVGASGAARFDECMKDESDSDVDMDVSIDINKIGNAQAHELNSCGRQYGMKSNDFYSFLTKDADEADALRMAREEEQEKIMFSGRKSRRERRAQRERKFAGRPLSPPSYAAKEELVPRTFVETNDSSRSPSPVNSGKITYITSFGGEDELQAHAKISFGFNRDMSTLGGIAGSSKASRMRAGIGGSAAEGGGTVSYADKVKQNLEKLKAQESKESDRKPPMQYQRTAAMGRHSRGKGSRSSSRSSRSSSSSHSRSRSRGRRRSFHSSRSRSRGRSKSPGAGTRSARRRPRGRAGGSHRSRSRSRGVEPATGRAGPRGVTTRQAYSRYRAARSKSKSRSRSHSRSHSRSPSRTRSRPRWSPRRRSPPPSYTSRRRRSAVRSSSSSSSSSTSSSRSRSRTPSARRPAAQQATSARTKRAGSGTVASDSEISPSRTFKKIRAQTTAVSQEKPPPLLQSSGGMAPQAILSTLPPLLPPPPPPPPAIGEPATSDVVDEKKPIAALALIEPEPEVPIKRYYGRRRGDESSSDALSTSGEEDTNDGDRKPRGLIVPDVPLGEENAVGTTSKIASTAELGIVQIKQEKPDTGCYGTSGSSPAAPTPAAGSGASLRFGKTVTGGTSAPESKVSGGPAPTTTTTTTTSLLASKSVNPRDRLKRKMQILLNKQYKADKKAEIEKVERQIQQQQERDDEMRELALKLRRRQRELRHKYGTPESEHSKSPSSGDDRSSDDGDGGGDGGQRSGGPGAAIGRDASTSPQRLPLLSPPLLTSVPPPKMPSHAHTSRPPPSLMVGRGGTAGYGNSVVIERKPVLRSASDSGGSTAQSAPPPMASYRADMGRLRRRNTPPPAPGIGGGGSSRGFTGGSGGGGMSPMTLRRGGGGGGMTAGRPPPAPSSSGSRFDDRSRRRSPQRYNRSRSKSRERFPSRDTTGQMGTGGNRGRRMPEYGRSRDYDRYHHGGSGDVVGSGYQSGASSGRFRGRRSRSGSRGRRSRSGSPVRTRGNGGGGSGQAGSTPNRPRERTPKPVKKLVDY